jgi:hypothetical protein
MKKIIIIRMEVEVISEKNLELAREALHRGIERSAVAGPLSVTLELNKISSTTLDGWDET